MTLDEAAIEETRQLAQLARVDRRRDLLDIGCGAGASIIDLTRGTRIRATGVDVSSYQLAQAADALNSKRLGSRVQLLHADLCQLPFERPSFDFVLSQATLFHVQDRSRALSEAHRVLSQGGVFVFDDLLQCAELTPIEKELVFGRLEISKLETIESYCRLLEHSKFTIEDALDRNNDLTETYTAVIAAFEKNEARVSDLIGKSQSVLWKASLQMTLACARQGKLTVGWFVARKR